MTKESKNTNSEKSSRLTDRMNDLEFELNPPPNRNSSTGGPSGMGEVRAKRQ